MEDKDNYVQVKMESNGTDMNIYLCQETNAGMKEIDRLSDSDKAKFKDTMYIKLTRLGNTYLAAVSPDGKDYIEFKKAVEGKYEKPKFMLVNGNGDKELSETLEAKFDYVKFSTEIGDVVKVGEDTKIKLTDPAPIERGAALTVEDCTDTDAGTYYAGFVADQDLAYRIDVEKSGYYNLVVRVASPQNGLEQLRLTPSVDGTTVGQVFSNGTGGEQAWQDMSLAENVKLTAGEHTFRLHTEDSGFAITFNLNWVQFKMAKAIEDGELRAAVNAAKAKDMALYSEEDQKKYAEAIKAAEEVLASTEDKAKFDEALKALKAVEESLVVLGGSEIKAELAAAAEAAKAIFEAGQGAYADDVWKAFTDAYNAAANPAEGATTEQLAQLKTALATAVAALDTNNNPNKPGNEPPYVPEQDVEVAKTVLKEAVEEAKATFEAGQGAYADDVWKDFTDAYKAAKDAVENPADDVTAEALDALTEALEDAKSALEKEPGTTPVDAEQLKVQLAEAVGNAKEIYDEGQGSYTNSTWRSFRKAYEAAEKALKEEEASAEDLAECLEDLEKAQSKLKKNANADENPDEGTSGDENPADDDTQDEQKSSNAGQNVPTNQQPSGNQQPVAQYMSQVQVTADTTELYVGGDADNTATVKVSVPNGAAIQKVAYSTTNTGVASVSTTGKVTARRAGDVTVKANVTLTNGETKEFAISLTVEKARIDKVNVPSKIKKGKRVTLKAEAYGSDKRITWKVKKGSRYAKVTRNGKLTARAKGTVKVQAKAGKLSKTFTIRIR